MNGNDVNKAILYLLQQDSRRTTTQEMAERIGVSASAIRTRIEQMEDEGIIRGYYPSIDYDKAGLQLHLLFICRAPELGREALATEARTVRGVVGIREVLNGSANVQIEAVGTNTDDVARITDELSDLGLTVVNSKLIKSASVQPFDHFGEQIVGELDDQPVP
ncbi:Lrp/AsnC family transcriptional regulator [Natrinema gelatinilyticum]|uniref:Lrp/AsnC family transcriptional regulator n=1 Tax=Natrinema gelatinilyticum TaxID=2961571 RepID=UPI0020C4BDF0|nr:Lrp/AsnC family transcriptional regulator [Natrinema gelatinilyticum]